MYHIGINKLSNRYDLQAMKKLTDLVLDIICVLIILLVIRTGYKLDFIFGSCILVIIICVSSIDGYQEYQKRQRRK